MSNVSLTTPEASTPDAHAAMPLAYRCSKCFQTRCSTVASAGQVEDCDLCGHENTVPEATEDRISQGESFLQRASTGAVNQFNLTNEPAPLSTAEIMRQCRKKSLIKHGVSGMVASRSKRLIGSIIDGAAMTIALIIGIVLVEVVSRAIGTPAPGEEQSILYTTVVLSVLFLFPAVLQFAQFVMTARNGRTIGKYCANTKVVLNTGSAPGFLKGVVMRSWLTVLLGMLPFYSMIDVLWIFTNDSNKCVHDLLAGTTVIDAT